MENSKNSIYQESIIIDSDNNLINNNMNESSEIKEQKNSLISKEFTEEKNKYYRIVEKKFNYGV